LGRGRAGSTGGGDEEAGREERERGNCKKKTRRGSEGKAGRREAEVEVDFFFFFAWLLSLVASTSSNPAFFETLDPLSTFPPSLFSSTMIAARTRPTMCMASAAKPAPSKVLQRASREQKGLERGGQSSGSMRLTLLSFSLSLSTRGRRGREASPKNSKLGHLCPWNCASCGAWFWLHLGHSMAANVSLSLMHCVRHAERKNDPARGHE